MSCIFDLINKPIIDFLKEVKSKKNHVLYFLFN